MRGAGSNFNYPSAHCAFPSEKRLSEQYHSFIKYGDLIVCAAGDAGMVFLDDKLMPVSSFRTKGVCLDIILKDGYVITAEDDMGAAVYRIDRTSVTELSRLPAEPLKPFRELVDCGRYIAAQLGSVFVQALRLDGETLVSAGDALAFGLLYHRHLARTTADGYLIVLSLAGGPALVKSGENGFERADIRLGAETCPIEEGACGYKNGLILIYGAKYYWLSKSENISSLPEPVSCRGALLKGLPFICGDKLVLLNRVNGNIEVIDISDPASPKAERLLRTGLHPEFAAKVGNEILIACGHDGVIKI